MLTIRATPQPMVFQVEKLVGRDPMSLEDRGRAFDWKEASGEPPTGKGHGETLREVWAQGSEGLVKSR